MGTKEYNPLIRATMIQTLMDKGIELSKISMVTGHSDLNTLRVYGNQQV